MYRMLFLFCIAACAPVGGSVRETFSVPPLTPTVLLPTATSTPASLAAGVKPGVSFHVQLGDTIRTFPGVGLYEVDLFDTGKEVIGDLKRQGAKVICYFSAGSIEDWRPDFSSFPSIAKGRALAGWEGEVWLDTRNSVARSVLSRRLDLAKSKGCDGVDPDNVDGYTTDTGFSLTEESQLDFNRWFAREAKSRGLLVSLKNSTDLSEVLQPDFDFTVVEECAKFEECERYASFVQVGKAVLMIEYGNRVDSATCDMAKKWKYDLVFYNIDLDGKQRLTCPSHK